MSYAWLKPILEVLVEWLEKRSAKTPEMVDANTPQSIRDRWASSLRDRLRDIPAKQGRRD